ncbi:MAG: P-loop NTPase fold protein [Cetobacterium sp.]
MNKRKWIINFIISVIIFGTIGYFLRIGLSSDNLIKMIINSEIDVDAIRYHQPYIFTNNLNHFFITIIITIVIYFYICIFYTDEKSYTSRKQITDSFIRILWGESLVFSFIFGTNPNFYEYEVYFIFVILFTIFLYLFFVEYKVINKEENDKEKENKGKKIFESRKEIFPVLKGYLNTVKSISIVGNWGVGKTFFINEFLNDKNNKDCYEKIYIDVSLFSEDKDLINNINNQLNNILSKNNILINKNNIFDALFYQPESWLKTLYLCLIKSDNFLKSQEILKNKINEISLKKTLICLDNLERTGSKERIKKILSLIEEILPDNIIRIYLYDSEKISEIFSEEKFKEYIQKYSEQELSLKEPSLNELTDELFEFEGVKEEYLLMEEKLEKIKIDENFAGFSKEIETISESLRNPRLINQCSHIMKNEKIKYSNTIKFYYALINKIFLKFVIIDSEKIKNIYSDKLTNCENMSQEKLVEIIIYLFFFKNEMGIINEENLNHLSNLLDGKWEELETDYESEVREREEYILDNLKKKIDYINISDILTYIGLLSKKYNNEQIKSKLKKVFIKDKFYIIDSLEDVYKKEFYYYILELLDDEDLERIRLKEFYLINDKKKYEKENKDNIVAEYLAKFKEIPKVLIFNIGAENYKNFTTKGYRNFLSEEKQGNYKNCLSDINLRNYKSVNEVSLFEYIDNQIREQIIDEIFSLVNSIELQKERSIIKKIMNLSISQKLELKLENEKMKNKIKIIQNHLKRSIGKMIFSDFYLVEEHLYIKLKPPKNEIKIYFTVDDLENINEIWNCGEDQNQQDAKDIILIELTRIKKKGMESKNTRQITGILN